MSRRFRLGLAVSGGADSVALALLLADCRDELDFEATVLHVDHGLRPDSASDARFVMRLARRLGMPCHVHHARVRRRSGESLEMAARRVRLDFFARMTARLELDAIATGHHADDVAETFLLRLARGSGAEGLAGLKRISRVGPITFVRPLLDLRDCELREFLEDRGESWREDFTNLDISIPRNRVRRVVIPWLRDNFDPHIVGHLIKSAAILRGDLHLPPPSSPRPTPETAAPPRYDLTVAPSVGFERRAGAIGRLPAVCELDRAALAARTLELRPWREGDRIAPTGMEGRSRKLQDVFVTAKVPVDVRRHLPILADAATGEVLWVPGYRVAASVAVSSPTASSWRFTLVERR